jgi:hypothetical protein
MLRKTSTLLKNIHAFQIIRHKQEGFPKAFCEALLLFYLSAEDFTSPMAFSPKKCYTKVATWHTKKSKQFEKSTGAS